MGDLRFWRDAGRAELTVPVPGSCRVCGERADGSRTGAEPGRVAAPAGVLEGRRSAGPMMWLREVGSRGVRVLFACWSVPDRRGFPVRGSAVGCAHPFACPGPLGPGRHGAVRVKWWAVRRGQSRRRAHRRDLAAALSNRRPRAWPLARAWSCSGCAGGGPAGGWDRQRICPSRIP